MRDDPYWTSRKNNLELIELFSINKVSLLHLSLILNECEMILTGHLGITV